MKYWPTYWRHVIKIYSINLFALNRSETNKINSNLDFENIIKTSQAYAELARRSQININDVEKSFKEWNIKTGALEGHIEKCLKGNR